jgi:hypothetical protein
VATVRIEFETDNPAVRTFKVCLEAAHMIGTYLNANVPGPFVLHDASGQPVGYVSIEK